MITKDSKGSEISMHASKGTCFKTPPNTTHTFVAITNVTCVAMLSKPWDDCEIPIVHEELVPFDEEYQKYMEEINTMGPEVYRYLNFHEIASYKEAAENAVLPTLTIETSKP